MKQDFASKVGAKARRKHSRPPPSAGAWFMGGLLTGVFLCGLAWLAWQRSNAVPIDPGAAVEGATTEGAATEGGERGGLRFDFYTLLPKQRVEVDVTPEDIAAARDSLHQYLLQAGSFKQAQDAEQRRAELALLGLTARVQERVGDNGRWFRVYVGPFESRSRLAKARDLTAQQGIDTLLLRRPKPDSAGQETIETTE